MHPDAKFGKFRGAHTRLLQGKQYLPAMMRIVADEIAEQHETGAVFDAYPLLHDPRQALLDAVGTALERTDQLSTRGDVLGFEMRYTLEELTSDMRAPHLMHVPEDARHAAAGRVLAVFQ